MEPQLMAVCHNGCRDEHHCQWWDLNASQAGYL